MNITWHSSVNMIHNIFICIGLWYLIQWYKVTIKLLNDNKLWYVNNDDILIRFYFRYEWTMLTRGVYDLDESLNALKNIHLFGVTTVSFFNIYKWLLSNFWYVNFVGGPAQYSNSVSKNMRFVTISQIY